MPGVEILLLGEIIVKNFKFALVVILGDLMVAWGVAILSLGVVRFTGLPSGMDYSIVSTDQGWAWVDMSNRGAFDENNRNIPHIVAGRAQLFLMAAWLVAAIVIPIVFVVIDRYVFAITLTAQRRATAKRKSNANA